MEYLHLKLGNPLGTDLSEEEEDIWKFTDKDGVVVKVSKTQSYDDKNNIMHWTTFGDWRFKKTTSRGEKTIN